MLNVNCVVNFKCCFKQYNHTNFYLAEEIFSEAAAVFEDQNKLAIKLEKEHVQEIYEEIATHFSHTRHKPWPRIAEVS